MSFAQTISSALPGRLGISKPALKSASARRDETAEISDEQLFSRVCRAPNGDPDSFNLLVTRYRARMVALVRRMLASPQTGIDPEDIAQEAFIDAFRRRHTFRAGSQLRPWLYGIAVNRCLSQLRSQGRLPSEALEPEHLEKIEHAGQEESGDPLGILISRYDSDTLERGVSALPPKLRAVLVLRYLDDMQYEEIAAALSLPVGTVKTNLFRARAELRTRMENANRT